MRQSMEVGLSKTARLYSLHLLLVLYSICRGDIRGMKQEREGSM